MVGKSPIFLSPSPPQNLGIFGDFSPKEPQSLGFPRPQSVPKHFKSCNPVPIPKVWGFSGINPNKSPKFRLSPSPNCPQVFTELYPHPHPRNLGFPSPQSIPKFRGFSGIKLATLTFFIHTNTLEAKSKNFDILKNCSEFSKLLSTVTFKSFNYLLVLLRIHLTLGGYLNKYFRVHVCLSFCTKSMSRLISIR